MAELFLPADMSMLTPRNHPKEKEITNILNKFLDTGEQIVEFNWKETTNYKDTKNVLGSMRAIISRNNIPIMMCKRGDRIFFVRKETK